jgi:hypothetical protein
MAEWLLRASDQWDVQATIKRVNESLIARGYVTWFDLTNMKGEYSTDDTAAAAAAATDATDAIPPSKDIVSCADTMQVVLWTQCPMPSREPM